MAHLLAISAMLCYLVEQLRSTGLKTPHQAYLKRLRCCCYHEKSTLRKYYRTKKGWSIENHMRFLWESERLGVTVPFKGGDSESPISAAADTRLAPDPNNNRQNLRNLGVLTLRYNVGDNIRMDVASSSLSGFWVLAGPGQTGVQVSLGPTILAVWGAAGRLCS
jgi:hypothetical protein